jgi:hypothetical protein
MNEETSPLGPRIWKGHAPQDAPSLSHLQTVRMPRAPTNVKDRFGSKSDIGRFASEWRLLALLESAGDLEGRPLKAQELAQARHLTARL